MCGRRDIEYQLRRATSGTGHFFLIDEPSIVDEVNGFDTFYRKFCASAQGVCAEFETSKISEARLLKRLNENLVRRNLQIQSGESACDSLYQLMDKQKQGLISITAQQSLEKERVQLISGLLDYARRKNLAWKVFLVADTFSMDDAVLAQFGIDQTIPDKSVDPAAPDKNKSARNRKKSALAYKRLRSRNSLPARIVARLKLSLLPSKSFKIVTAGVLLVFIAVISSIGLQWA
jgi:hypothetical protein